MIQLLWKLFESSGNVSSYLFYRAMEDRKRERFLKNTNLKEEKKAVQQ